MWRRKAKQKVLEKFVDKKLIASISNNVIAKNELYRIVLLVASLTFFVLALMRPQYGFEWQEIRREGLDILVAIDTSKSMLTNDVKPNRLERSKLAVKDL